MKTYTHLVFDIDGTPVSYTHLQRFNFADSVFEDEDRFSIPVVNFIRQIPQTVRIDLPAPFVGLQMRIFQSRSQVAAGAFLLVSSRGRDDRLVIRIADPVRCPLLQKLQFAILNLKMDLVLFKIGFSEIRLFALRLHVPVSYTHLVCLR